MGFVYAHLMAFRETLPEPDSIAEKHEKNRIDSACGIMLIEMVR
jgi:hypothetical protein